MNYVRKVFAFDDTSLSKQTTAKCARRGSKKQGCSGHGVKSRWKQISPNRFSVAEAQVPLCAQSPAPCTATDTASNKSRGAPAVPDACPSPVTALYASQ